MNEELQYLWYHMRGDFGWVMAFISWVTALRLVFKPVTKFLESYIQQAGAADGAWASRILESRAYKFAAFLLDYLASVKLPERPRAEAPIKSQITDLKSPNGPGPFGGTSLLIISGLVAIHCYASI